MLAAHDIEDMEFETPAEPRLGLAPLGAVPMPMMLWASVFAAMYAATTAVMASAFLPRR
jgi:hypothetical protein